MLTPNDIANKKFEKSMNRYKIEEVDSFLNQVAEEMDNLIADKRDLEKKIMVLADKLEEYKQDEESLRAALLGAQKLGGSVVRDAKEKAQMIIDEANQKAAEIVESSKTVIEKERTSYQRLQREVATFKSRLQLMYKQHLEMISNIPADESSVNPPEAAEPVQASPEAEEPVYEQPAPVYEEPARQEEYVDEYDTPIPVANSHLSYTEEEEYHREEEFSSEPPARESRFGPLKFGKEFDIKRDDEKRKK
ncbi:DivIVA domain-containing protein [Youxingia wuxianensis]|uniref:DivIVA domain-containing protein n=1 Tax=Youxingia wuxianensis TaxID=2763678 RepID=A0A926IBP9_9FIRM|nr:DivIVA domain-containing protein [Youxingia wuxianensis]MBC8584337.1 DivIVA domain-containing protein [Youxingia wuxianensis]